MTVPALFLFKKRTARPRRRSPLDVLGRSSDVNVRRPEDIGRAVRFNVLDLG